MINKIEFPKSNDNWGTLLDALLIFQQKEVFLRE